MAGELEHLRGFDLEKPSAHVWNGMLDEVRRRSLRLQVGSGRGGALAHPWQTVCSRWENPTGMAKERAWRIDVRAGWVNDEPAVIPYLRSGDPRGWRMADDYPAPKKDDGGYDERWVGRWMNEAEDAPFLTIEAPPQGGIENASGRAIVDAWEAVAKADFPPYFTEFYPEYLLFRATVLVTAARVSPREYYPEVPAPKVGAYRLGCGKRPNVVPVAKGGFLELAWLWLVREPERRLPEEDEMLVQPLVFYDLACRFIGDATRWWTV